jgi:HSP20 family protein
MARTLAPRGIHSPRWLESPMGLGSTYVLDRFRREMDRMMEDFFGGGDGGERHEWYLPRANITESDKDYVITLDLPGVKSEDVSVEFKDGELWITGERKLESEHEGKTFLCSDCQYGAFRRIISLNEAVKADKIHAEYKDGVLRLTVPKDESVQPKRIKVVHA